jgi:hypothetical protein
MLRFLSVYTRLQTCLHAQQLFVPAAVKEAVEHTLPAIRRAQDFFVAFFELDSSSSSSDDSTDTTTASSNSGHIHTVLSEGFTELRAAFSRLAGEIIDVSTCTFQGHFDAVYSNSRSVWCVTDAMRAAT